MVRLYFAIKIEHVILQARDLSTNSFFIILNELIAETRQLIAGRGGNTPTYTKIFNHLIYIVRSTKYFLEMTRYKKLFQNLYIKNSTVLNELWSCDNNTNITGAKNVVNY